MKEKEIEDQLRALSRMKLCHPEWTRPRQDSSTEDFATRGDGVFVGFGLSSKIHGITRGLPIDVLLMLISAHRLSLLGGKIHFYLADNLAQELLTDKKGEITAAQIAKKAKEILALVEKIFQRLNISNVEIHTAASLGLEDDSFYQAAKTKVEQFLSDNQLLQNPEDLTTRNYVIQQTALVAFFQHKKNCVVKVGWCENEKKINETPHPTKSAAENLQHVVRDGLKQKKFDELWFDTFYQLCFNDTHPLGFVYTSCGRVSRCVPGSNSNTSSPYFAREQSQHPRVCFGDSLQVLNEQKIANKKKPGYELPVYQLPPTFKSLACAIINALRAWYQHIPLQSKPDEYRPHVIVGDLATISELAGTVAAFTEGTAANEAEIAPPGDAASATARDEANIQQPVSVVPCSVFRPAQRTENSSIDLKHDPQDIVANGLATPTGQITSSISC